MNWPRAHWIVGTSTLVAFLLAGGYMRYIADVPHLADAPRLVFRSRFLLLLLLAVANLGLSYARPKRFIQRLASAVILLSPVSVVVAFFLDPGRGVQSSPWTVFTMRALFAAGVLLVIALRPGRAE